MTCIFCHKLMPEQTLYENEHFKVIFDIDPIQTGHLLIISKEHVESLTELPLTIRHELIDLEAELITLLETTLPIDGVTIASNDKGLMDAGTHFHVHLIPRRKNDGFWDSINPALENWDLTNFLSSLH